MKNATYRIQVIVNSLQQVQIIDKSTILKTFYK